MHKSRLAGFIIDCNTDDLEAAADFWSAALGFQRRTDVPDELEYIPLDARAAGLSVEVQRVDHPSRVHLDIETDDVDAEVARLEALGAKRVANVRSWWVMEAPTGQRFCVVRAARANFDDDGKPVGEAGFGGNDVDGIISADYVADCILEGIREERFLVLPHRRHRTTKA